MFLCEVLNTEFLIVLVTISPLNTKSQIQTDLEYHLGTVLSLDLRSLQSITIRAGMARAVL